MQVVPLVDEDRDKVLDYIPVQKKNQLIIPYSEGQFQFTDRERQKLIEKSRNEQIVDQTINEIKRNNLLNPQRNNIQVQLKKSGQFFLIKFVKIFLYFGYFIILLLLLYIFLGVFIFFLGDPVICIAYGYYVIYKLWWTIGNILIAKQIVKSKCSDLKNYLNKWNKLFYYRKQIIWSLGYEGKWIIVDFKESKQ